MNTRELIRNVCLHNPWAIVMLVLVMTFSNFVQASSAVTIAPVVDLILHPDLKTLSQPTAVILEWMGRFSIPKTLVSVMLLFLFMIIFKNIVNAFSKWVLLRLSNSFLTSLIFDQYRTFLSARWEFFVFHKQGILSNTIFKETERVGIAIEAIGDILSSALGIMFYLTLGFMISWKLTLVVLGMLGIGLIPFFLLGKYTYKLGKAHTDNSNELFTAIQETLGAVKLVIGYGNQKKSLEKTYKIVPRYMSMIVRFVLVREATPLVFEPFGFFIILSTVFIGVNFFGINVAELLLLLYAFRLVSQNALNIASRRNSIKNLLPAFEQIQTLRSEAIAMKQPSGVKHFNGFKDRIVMDNLQFQYSSEKQALNGVNILIPKGKMIAIVGRSGSGKTTLIDVLMGFYTPQRGIFSVDGYPFTDLDVTSWRQKIGYIPQEAGLFNMSIKDNLLWGYDQASAEDMERVLEMSYSNEFIKDLPTGIDTIVGEHGVRLSGGQRQRLALARAILRKPELLILDEATSALDSHSELLIQESIEELAKTTTIIAIAHRLSTIKRADYIYVLDNGKVIEEGTFERLISLKGGQFLKTAEIQGVL